MAGCVTVAIYPTVNDKTLSFILEHSDAKLLVVGKLDVWDGMKSGVPDGFKLVALPLAPSNDYESFDVDVSLFKDGSNLIAVEVHQATSTSSDLGFDLSLSVTTLTTE